MKLTDIHESWYRQPIEVDGYTLRQEEELEEDNRKIFHFITPPGGKETHIDHSPYEWLGSDTIRPYIEFHKEHGRFPSRRDINSRGPLHNDDMDQLLTQK